jgi:hypothetical protein
MNQAEMNFDAPPRKDASEIPVSLLEKIKKLLRLASSSNPHEAALALSRAMALADRANLDLSSLREDDEVGEIVDRWVPVGSRLSRERSLALGIVQLYFNVKPVYSRMRGSVMFIGTDADIAIADDVFEFLTRSSRDCLKSYEANEALEYRKSTPTKRASFLAGFFYGGQRKEILLEDHKFAIVLRTQEAAREEYADSNCGPCKSVALRKHRRNYSALETGYHDGKRTSINPGLGAPKSELRLK